MVSYMEYTTLSWTFHVLLPWNLLVYLAFWMDLTYTWFWTHDLIFGKHWLMTSADFPNVNTRTVWRDHICEYQQPSHQENPLSTGIQSVALNGRRVFSNSNFHLKAQTLSLATSSVTCCLGSDRVTSFFSRKYVPNTQVRRTSLSNQLFFQVETKLHKKCLIQLATWLSH